MQMGGLAVLVVVGRRFRASVLSGGGGGRGGENGFSHCWIRDQARSLTALWIGMMEGMVRASESAGEGPVLVVERLSGLCLRRTAVKN